ncbi:MAG: flagellar biosynthesis protein FlhB [Chloroflexi bacterium]|nr:flagellar biosynthesis protein FlhB [Chloroflexota bacterium]
MAEERTEAATPKRREEVRKRGQTARSQDLTTAAVLLAGLYALKTLGGTLKDQLSGLLVANLLALGDLDKNALPTTETSGLGALAAVLPPLLGALALAAIIASVIQGGSTFAPGLLSPKSERVNPIAGTKRILSIQSLIQLGKSLAKFGTVGLAATIVIRGNLSEIAGLGSLDLMPATSVIMGLVWDIAFKSALAMLLLGLLDWLWERRRFLNSIRMTKQEVKEENRQSEGDPHVRAQLKSKRQQFLQQMMKDVRTADVVITNPTHFAVALKYDPESMGAPRVIAKGQDYLALRLREAAKEARVPVLENKPLARALYKLVPVGKEIPAELYVAVAEVLAFVFRLKREHQAA